MQSDIKIRSFTGNAIKTHIPSIVRLRSEIFREYPYLQETDIEKERSYLEKYQHCKESIAVIVFDGTIAVGASTGLPFQEESSLLQSPFLKKDIKVSPYFYFSESVLLKPYRGRGIGHHFFDLREVHAKGCKKFKHICFCTIDRPDEDPLRPLDYMPLNDFWRKRGFVYHPEMRCTVLTRDINEEIETEKTKSFWVKDIV